MTTNSPNPVDGDVQSYRMPCLTEQQRQKQISFCEAVIKSSWADPLMVENCLISLAALTAKPGLFEWRFKETDTPASPWMTLPMEKLERSKEVFGDLVEYRFWFESSPAQLLRPVELPGFTYDAEGEPWIHGDEVVDLLMSLGYEVKS